MPPKVRDARPTEAARVYALLTKAFAASNLPFTVYRSPRSVLRLSELAEAGRVRVTDDLTGIAIVTGSHLEYLVVDACSQGGGIGRALMQDFHASHPHETTLDVLTENARARDWYASLGYMPEKVRLALRLALQGSGTPPETWSVALAQEKVQGFGVVDHDGMKVGLLDGTAFRLLDAGGRSPEAAMDALQGLGRSEAVLLGIDCPPEGFKVIQRVETIRMRRAA